MKIHAITLLCAGLAFTAHAADGTNTLKTTKEKASYAIGFNIGRGMKSQNLDIDVEALSKGLKTSLVGSNSLLSDKEAQEVLEGLQKEMMAKAEAKAGESKKAGETFLEENKKKEGVKTTASGLQYKVIKEGTGPLPKETDTVETHYKGTLTDGTEFDSSYKSGEPVSFVLNEVIPGWREGVQLMKVGSKYQFFIPAALAYGERGQGPIPGNSTLIFELELLGIKK